MYNLFGYGVKLRWDINTYLEKLSSFWYNPDKNDKERQMTESRHTVLEHIRKIRLEHSGFTGIKEEPVIIAGEIRGIEEPDSVSATKVTAEGFYSKTIRIKHGTATGSSE